MSYSLRDRMTIGDIVCAYNRWARVYDKSFVLFASYYYRKMVEEMNQCQGRVLDIGVGTGAQLPYYGRHLEITGIDLSPAMLDRARSRVAKLKLNHVKALVEGDAARMNFPDKYFNAISASFVMSVVPDPQAVLKEMDRVLVDGGEIFILNHFLREKGLRHFIERMFAPLSSRLGWHTDIPIKAVTDYCPHPLVACYDLKPFGIFTMLRFRKAALK